MEENFKVDTKQLDYILKILNDRRERYKLFWNALTGAIVAVGVGIGVGVVSKQIALSSFYKAKLFFSSIIFVPLIVILFFSIFFEILVIEALEQYVVFQFHCANSPFYQNKQPPIIGFLSFISKPLPIWGEWQHKRDLYFRGSIFVLISGFFLIILPSYSDYFLNLDYIGYLSLLGFVLFILYWIGTRTYSNYKKLKFELDGRNELALFGNEE